MKVNVSPTEAIKMAYDVCDKETESFLQERLNYLEQHKRILEKNKDDDKVLDEFGMTAAKNMTSMAASIRSLRKALSVDLVGEEMEFLNDEE